MKRTTITFSPRIQITIVLPLISPRDGALFILALHWLGFL